MPSKIHALKAHIIHEPEQHIDIFRDRKIAVFAIRLAEAPEVERVGPMALGNVIHRRQPIAPRAKPAVQKDDRLAAPAYQLVMNQSVVEMYRAHSINP